MSDHEGRMLNRGACTMRKSNVTCHARRRRHGTTSLLVLLATTTALHESVAFQHIYADPRRHPSRGYQTKASKGLLRKSPGLKAHDTTFSSKDTVSQSTIRKIKEPGGRGGLVNAVPKFNPTPFAYLEELEFRVDTLTNLGDGVGRVNDWVIMVPHTIPGELIKAKVYRNHKTYSQATLTAVIDPSPHRVEAKCPLFGVCGGCQYQHMSIEAQRDWKRQQVVDGLTRIGGLKDANIIVNKTLGTDEIFGYRSKITPHNDSPYPPSSGELRAIGFMRAQFPTIYGGVDLEEIDTHRIVDVTHCPIAVPEINEKLPEFREEVRRREKERAASIQAGEPQPKRKKRSGYGASHLLRLVEEGVVTDMSKIVTERVGDLQFKFKATEFFQNNPFVLPSLIKHVTAQASANGSMRYLIDAYCGGGLFALCSSRVFDECSGVEVSPAAVQYAKENAKLNNIQNCSFLQGTAADIFSGLKYNADVTCIVIDPPRKGCDNVFLAQLFEFFPKRIVYVSCDPSTQARDAKKIVACGYKILDVTPFDLFPQTRHIENVITFERGDGKPEPSVVI